MDLHAAIRTENAGQELTATNFWSTEQAQRGLVYVTINAGAVRILVPPAIEDEVITAARTAQSVLLSRGPWRAHGGREGVEILLEDGSQSPFAIHVDARQCDRRWGAGDHGRELPCSVWVRGEGADGVRKAAELPGRLRVVQRIPWLKPWGGA